MAVQLQKFNGKRNKGKVNPVNPDPIIKVKEVDGQTVATEPEKKRPIAIEQKLTSALNRHEASTRVLGAVDAGLVAKDDPLYDETVHATFELLESVNVTTKQLAERLHHNLTDEEKRNVDDTLLTITHRGVVTADVSFITLGGKLRNNNFVGDGKQTNINMPDNWNRSITDVLQVTKSNLNKPKSLFSEKMDDITTNI